MMLRAAESEVINAIGGSRSPWIQSHMRRSDTFTVSQSDNTISLPDGAGPILPGGVFDADGEQWAVLKEEESSLAGTGSLYKRAVVRNGNALTFHGIPSKSQKQVTVTYVSSLRKTFIVDGCFVTITENAGKLSGRTLSKLTIERPYNLTFPDGHLEGAIARIFISDNIANDYSVISGIGGIYVDSSPVSVNPASVNTTSMASKGAEFPCMFAYCAVPERLRPAMLEYFKYLESRDSRYLQAMLTITKDFTNDIS